MSSLPGKALRMLVDIMRLAEQINKHSLSRTLEIWYQKTWTWNSIISLPIVSLFKVAIMT